MKLLEKILGVVLINKIKLFIRNNKRFTTYKKMLLKGTNNERFFAIMVPIINIFIFGGFFQFVIILGIDYYYINNYCKEKK